MIDFTTFDNFNDFQNGFYIRDNKEKDIGKIRFVLKCFTTDYAVEYEFRDEALKLGLVTEENPKLIK
jgi:hypothetical protein